MKEEKQTPNTSLIKISSNGLMKVNNSLQITNKILKESLERKKDDFKSVIIGEQEWMLENLNVAHFRNGEPIPEAKTNDEWERAGMEKTPAWCYYYDNDPENGKKYGKLYNWFAVNDPRGLAPEGWHVPCDNEWTRLTDYLGGEEIAGTKMKNTSGWGGTIKEHLALTKVVLQVLLVVVVLAMGCSIAWAVFGGVLQSPVLALLGTATCSLIMAMWTGSAAPLRRRRKWAMAVSISSNSPKSSVCRPES